MCLKKNKLPLYQDDTKDTTNLVVDIRKPYFTDKEAILKECYGEDGYDFMLKCLDQSSKTRLSSKKALEHPYLAQSTKGLFGGSNKILNYISSTLFKPEITQSDYLNKQHEFEFIEEIYKNYKDTTIDVYSDLSRNIDINYRMIHMSNDWIFSVIRKLDLLSVETLLQYLLCLSHCASHLQITRKNLQLLCASIVNLQHKLFTTYRNQIIETKVFIHLGGGAYDEDEFNEMERTILESYDYILPIKPILFFLNYWYLKAIYTHPERRPDINILVSSIGVMISQLIAMDNKKMVNINISDLAKYCVQEAIVQREYQDYANMDLLKLPSDILQLFDENLNKFKNYKTNYISRDLEDYDYILEMLDL